MSVASTLRRTWPVLVSYAVFSAWGLACLVTSIFLTNGGGDALAIFGIVIATAVGHVAGNALGLARFRLAVIFVMFALLFTAGTFLAAALGPIGVYALVAMVAALSGYLGVASRLDVVAAWFPLSLSVGAAILWMNSHNALETFEEGRKHAIWDPFTLTCLAGTVFLMLVFLATHNALSLTAWQEVGRMGGENAHASGTEAQRVGVARPGRGSLLVLFVFTVVVLGATAAVSPYLFRTREDPNAKDGKGQTAEHDGKGKDGEHDGKDHQGKGGKDEKGKGKGKKKGGTAKKGHGKGNGRGNRGHGSSGGAGNGDQGDGDQADGDQGDDHGDDGAPEPDTEHASEAASEALRLGAKILWWLFIAALVFLFLYLVVFPPIRRRILLRHLERPLWQVAPTARVMNLWRRARAALADAGIEPELGETARDFARRATAEVNEKLGCDAPGLADAAAIVEKIDYAGRGLHAEDANAMRAAVTALVAEIAPRVKMGRRIKNWWGQPPEVEA